MTWRHVIPNLFTLAAMLCGFFSILLSLEGADNYKMAAQLIMLAMILDGLDGTLARRLKGSTEFGAELDTYVDMTAFGLAPAVLIYQVTLQNYDIFWRILMTSFVVLSGVVRLARFKVKDTERGQGGYTGLPITACGGWVAIFVFLSETRSFSLDKGPLATIFIIGVLAMVTLQISNVRYPKPTKQMAIFIPSIIMVLLLFFHVKNIAVGAAVVILLFGASYVILGPLFVSLGKLRKRDNP